MNIDKTTCWYNKESISEMNRFYFTHKDNPEVNKHFDTLRKLVEDTDIKNGKVIDLGCGNAVSCNHVNNLYYVGADLKDVIEYCSKVCNPQNEYIELDLNNDEFNWIANFQIVLLNGVIDVMQYPLDILDKVLKKANEYVIIHRQEITEKSQTRVISNGSYGGVTYHAIINKKDFEEICDKNDFEIVRSYNLHFSNWENNGNSFLLRKRKLYSINNIAPYLYQKYFFGKNNLTFLEAGANDGITQSNTMYFEHYKNWSGILIEPINEVYNKLIENRSIKNKFYNCALVPEDYVYETIEMIYTPENYGMLSVINDEMGKVLLKRCIRELQIPEEVKAITLNSVLSESKLEFPKINLMILDIEGYEYNVMKNLDFEQHDIEYILVEELDSSDKIEKLLKKTHNKIDQLSEHDYLYKIN